MAVSYARASRIASSCPKDFNFASFMYANEAEYPMWTNPGRWLNFVKSRPESVAWNVLVAVLALITFILVSSGYESDVTVLEIPITTALDIAYNAIYALHVAGCMYLYENKNLRWYLVDFISYAHYLTPYSPIALQNSVEDLPYIVKISCYHMRLHRPFRFLWGLNDYYLKGSMSGTLLKYWYIFTILHIIGANIFLWLKNIAVPLYENIPHWLTNKRTRYFYRAFYVVYKRFIPIGIDVVPRVGDSLERLSVLLAFAIGSLLVTGITIASLSLAIGLRMRPEEMFRARVRIILNGMKNTRVPAVLCEKVETFYRMYWHKQKAISDTHLLPTYPPTLAKTINTDIYFEAQQKSISLRDLSYQFLSEIAQRMKTINYIPGDIIVKRNCNKFAMIYISYGDVEMLTAEDDETPILRFTRGSIINPCAGAAVVANSPAHVCIRAATFCTAHVLTAVDIWRVSAKYGRVNGQSFILQSSFDEHFANIKRHYAARPHPPEEYNKYKSTILILKRNLIELKEARDDNGKLILGRQDIFLELAGCYIMRNQADAALTEEADSICLRPTFPCILQPASSLLITWKIFVAIMTIVVTFVHPYNLVFIKTPHEDFRFFDFMATVVYLVDIMVHLSTGAKIEEGVPVTFLQTSSQQVQNFWFVLDVISVMPIFHFIGDGSFAGINKVCKLPKVFRVLKEMEDMSLYQSNMLRFSAYCLLIILLNWLVATLQQGYMCFWHGYCNLKTITTEPYWEKAPLDDSGYAVSRRLWYSIYWALSFTNFNAHKTLHVTMHKWDMQLFIMILLEACGKFNIIMEAAYSATIMVKEAMRDQYKSCIENVKMCFVKNEVDPVLRHRFISYLQLCWYTDKAYSITHGNNSIYFDLPQHVYQDISGSQRNKYIVCIPFMKNLHPEIVKTLCAKAHLFYTSPNEILLNTGDISNEIYVIKQGFCEVIDPVTKNVVSIITAKDHFGDFECLMRIPAYYTVRAASHVQIFSISRKHLGSVLTTPKIKDAIAQTKLEPEYVSLLHHRQAPFLKYEMSPPPPSRQVFPILRKHEPDTAFLQPFQKLGFFSMTRYIFPRFTIRPDGKYLRRYEWFRAVCAILSAMIFPVYYLLVKQFEWLEYLSYFLDIAAYYDVFQRFLVAYFNENGILVYHPVSTAAHYIRGPMIVDLLGCLPFEHFDDLREKMYSNEKYQSTPDTMQYLMCNRILQLYRFPAALEILDEYIGRQDIIYVIKVIPILMVVLNTVTSFLVLLSVNAEGLKGGGWVLTPISTSYPSWINTDGDAVGYNITESPFNLFITVYYWATYEITTTGFDKFQSSRYSQLGVLTIGILIGSIMTSYFTVRVLSIRSNVNQALAAFQENMKDLIVFMEKEKFHKDLQEEAFSYYEYTWMKTGGADYRSILKLCDQITLRTDAILHIYGQTFHKCPILHKCDLSLQRMLGRAVHSVYYRNGMTVVDRNNVIAELYLVDYGTMEARDPEDDDLVVTKLPRGSMFGNLENKKLVVSPSKFVASTNLHLLMIEARIFYKILQDFPLIRGRMVKFRPNNENYVIGSLRDQNVAQTIWHERTTSTAIIIVTQMGLLNYIHTHDTVLQVILIIVSIICVYGDLYNAAFQDNRINLLALLYLMDAIFMCKIVIKYFMPTITEEKSESRHALEKAKQEYYRGEFKYDILSVLPVELFCFLFKNPWEAFAFLRLNRFLRVTTINSYLKLYHERLSINLTATTITATFIWFTLFVHTSTCIWYLLGVIHDNQEPQSSWRWLGNKTYLCGNDYICSLYFIMTTFSQNGAGDILPRQRAEVIYVIFLMILSTMMYMIYVGEFSNIMQYQFFRCFSFYSHFLELKEYLKYNRVSRNLVNLTNKYTLHLWRTSRGLQVPLFLRHAPPCLRTKLMSAAYMQHLKKHPAFKHCERAFLRHVVGYFKPFTYHEDMYVVREGEITNSMYFVHKGRIQELIEDYDEKTQVFETGDFFGSAQGLFQETPYTHSYKTLTKSQVLTLSYDDWVYLLRYFPQNKEIIYKPHKGLGELKGRKRLLTIKSDDSRISSVIHGFGLAVRSSDRFKDKSSTLKGVSPVRFGIPSGRESLQPFSDEVDKVEGLSILSAASIANVASGALNQSAEDSITQPTTLTKRKSNVLDIDSKSKEKKGSTEDSKPLSRIKEIDLYVKSQAEISRQSSIQYSDNDLWPLDSRRLFSLTDIVPKKKSDTKSSSEDLSKTKYSRRKSTVLDLDRDELQKELRKLSATEIVDDEPPSTSDYGRRKSKLLDVDKSGELKNIRDFDQLSPPAEPLFRERSSVEETELRNISYRADERSLLAPPSERSVENESVLSLNIPFEKSDVPTRSSLDYGSATSLGKVEPVGIKSILGKTKTEHAPPSEEPKTFLQKIKGIKSKPSEKSLAEKKSPSPGPSHLRVASDTSPKKSLRKAAPSILFKEEVTTIEIPKGKSSLETKSPSLARALSRHTHPEATTSSKSTRPERAVPDLSSKKEPKTPSLERARTERSFQDLHPKKEPKIPSLEKTRTERSLQDLPSNQEHKFLSPERTRTDRLLQDIASKKKFTAPLEGTRTERSLQDLPSTRTDRSLQDLPSKKEHKIPSLERSKTERSLQDLASKRKHKIPSLEGTKTDRTERSLQDLPSRKEPKIPTLERSKTERSLQDLTSKKDHKTYTLEKSKSERSLQDLTSKKDHKTSTLEKSKTERSLQDLPSKKDHKTSTLEKSKTERSLQDLPSKKDHKTSTLEKSKTERSLQDLPSKKDHKTSTLEKSKSERSLQDLPSKKDHKTSTLEKSKTERSLQDLPSKKDHKTSTLEKSKTERSLQDLPSKKDHKTSTLEKSKTERSLQDLPSKKGSKTATLAPLPSLKEPKTTLKRSRSERSLQDLASKKGPKTPTLQRSKTEHSLQDLPSKKEDKITKKEDKDNEASSSKK